MKIVIKGFDQEDSKRLAAQVACFPVKLSRHINKMAEIIIDNGNIVIDKKGGRWSDEVYEYIA